MNITFNAFEAFEIAEKIERHGAKYYRKAAELFDAPHIRNMFLKLANWETKHEEVFMNMRRQLQEQNPELRMFRPEDRMLPEAQAMAGLAVFGIESDPSIELTGEESVEDILKKAIKKEKDSIVFYNGLKGFVPAIAGKEKIDDIIREEMRHIRILSQSLEQREQAR